MFVYRACRVHLETVHAIVHEVFQVIHPVFLPGKGFSHRLCQRIFLRNAQVILDAEPKSHVIAHPMQAADKQTVILFLRIARGIPIGFSRKLLVVPFLLGRKVVTFLHPLRFEPEQVARDARLAEAHGIVQDVELIFQHIRTEA